MMRDVCCVVRRPMTGARAPKKWSTSKLGPDGDEKMGWVVQFSVEGGAVIVWLCSSIFYQKVALVVIVFCV